MTPREFKAWFEGFVEAMTDHPTPAQREKIKLRVGQIDGNPVSYPVYVDRYWPRRVVPWWTNEPYWASHTSGGVTVLNCASHTDPKPTVEEKFGFDPLSAMKALGLADYSEAH